MFHDQKSSNIPRVFPGSSHLISNVDLGSWPASRRLLHMLYGWGSVAVVYILTSSKDQSTAFMLPPSAVDLWFEFTPDAIWLYLSFFVLIPASYFLVDGKRVQWLARAMLLSAFGAGLVFTLWPTTMVYPEVTQTGVNARALKILMHYDSVHNCLPSLHVTLTLLAVWALWGRHKAFHNLFFTCWGIAISVAILQLHRHQFIDMISGACLGISAGLLAGMYGKTLSHTILRQG